MGIEHFITPPEPGKRRDHYPFADMAPGDYLIVPATFPWPSHPRRWAYCRAYSAAKSHERRHPWTLFTGKALQDEHGKPYAVKITRERGPYMRNATTMLAKHGALASPEAHAVLLGSIANLKRKDRQRIIRETLEALLDRLPAGQDLL